MKKLLLSAGLSAFALICQGDNPHNLAAAIGELGPVMSRPPNPKDKSDEQRIDEKYHCMGPVHLTDQSLGRPGRAPKQEEHEEERM